MRRKPHSPRLYILHLTLYTKLTKKQNNMKKVYLAPQTEAIQLLSENAIMAGSGALDFNPQWSDDAADAI